MSKSKIDYAKELTSGMTKICDIAQDNNKKLARTIFSEDNNAYATLSCWTAWGQGEDLSKATVLPEDIKIRARIQP